MFPPALPLLRGALLPLLLFLLLLLARPGGADAVIEVQTIVVTVAPALPTDAPEFVDGATFTSAILNSTNAYRAEHNASAVRWNTTLEQFATSYLDDVADEEATGGACLFQHSGGPYGENLALGCSNASSCVDLWGDERKEYDFSDPQFTEDTGHFTQLVWKDTTAVGCGARYCNNSGGWYLVCEYWPRGNVIGEFAQEVDAEENGSAVPVVRSPGLHISGLGVLLLILWVSL